MRKLFLSAGHSLNETGAIANNFKEADLTIDLRNLIAQEIRRLNSLAYVQLDSDKMSLRTYVAELSKKISPNDIIIDIHFNSASPSTTGTEAFIPFRATVEEQVLAGKVCNTISTTLNIKNRGVKLESQSQYRSLAIMRPNCTNLLFEVCFITNANDMKAYIKNKIKLAKQLATVFSYYL